MNGQEPHHREQLDELKSWITKNKKSTATVVLGDFNDTGKGLLPLKEASKFTQNAPTRMDKKEYDHIFAPQLRALR